MSGRVGSIPRSKDGMGDSSGNDCGVGGQISDPRQRCGVGGGMVGRGDGCGMGEGMVGLGNGFGVDEGIVGLGNGCGVDEGIVGLGDGCEVDGEGSGVGTTRGVATSGREGYPTGAELVLGLSVVLGSARVAASSFGPQGWEVVHSQGGALPSGHQ